MNENFECKTSNFFAHGLIRASLKVLNNTLQAPTLRPIIVKNPLIIRTTLLFISIIVISACAGKPSVTTNAAPDWVNELPKGKSAAVGSASYAIFGEAKARENATMKALAALALQKGGSVDLVGEVQSSQTVNMVNGGERISDRSTVTVNAVIKGESIPVKGKVQSHWKDTLNQRVWVLMIEDL